MKSILDVPECPLRKTGINRRRSRDHVFESKMVSILELYLVGNFRLLLFGFLLFKFSDRDRDVPYSDREMIKKLIRALRSLVFLPFAPFR